jgi:DNA-binding response OmpR family regulator/curved DNA-binding protein CbpA
MVQRILIAEDHQPLAESLVQLLAQRGYQVEHAASGNAALRSIAATPPDLLLLDLNLPGLHGVELLKKLRQSPRTRQLPVIIITGVYKEERYRQAAAALGVRHYLEKPFKAGTLLATISQELPATPPGRSSQPFAPATSAPRPFAQHLQEAFRRRFSGQLLLSWPETKRLMILVNGIPVALQPGFTCRDFGDYLRASGLLSPAEYTYYTGPGQARPETLVQIGCLPWHELLAAQLAHLDHELVNGFAAPPAQATWQALATPEALQLPLINVPQLFYRGFQRHPGRATAQLLATCLNRYPVPSAAFYRHINLLDLDEPDRRCLQRLDGRRTLAECTDEPQRAAPLLLTLASLDMLRFTDQPAAPVTPGDLPLRTLFNAIEESQSDADQPLESFDDLVEAETGVVAGLSADAAPAQVVPAVATVSDDLAQSVRLMARSLEGRNHYEVFGIKPEKFTIDLLKERYFAITRQYGPDILMQLSGDDAVLVEELLATVTNAYNTLSDVIKKERYDELLGADRIGLGHKGDDRFQAQVQAESGKVFIEMEEWDNAERALQEAVNFDTGNGDYLAHLAWAIYRNPKNAVSRAMHEKARQMLNRALTLERTAAGFAFKGWMLLEGGQESLAEAEFNKALKLDARSLSARRGLRTLHEKQAQQKKGLFGRMFK